MRDRVVQVSGKRNPTVRDFITVSGRGRPRMDMVGGPKEVADRLEEWFATGACDGFVISAAIVPGTYADFVRHVVPELQRRGLHRREYSGPTLRDHLGLGGRSAGGGSRARRRRRSRRPSWTPCRPSSRFSTPRIASLRHNLQ